MPELNSFRSIHIIIVLGLLVFGFCLFNGFVGDDNGYIFHPYIQQFEVLKLLTGGSTDLGGASPITSQFYRPLMLLVFAGIAKFFGTVAFPYHLVQVVLHITNAVLVYFLFRKYFTAGVACFLSLVFLVHPIMSETVTYISNLQDVLFVFWGMIGLHLLSIPYRRWGLYGGIGLSLFFSLLSKETGVLFLLMTLVYEFFLLRKDKLLILVVLVSSCLYGLVRFVVAGVTIGKSPESVMSTLSVGERLQHIPLIFQYYLSTFLFPTNLALGQTWTMKELSFETFYFPLLLFSTFSLGIFVLLFFLKSRKSHFLTLTLFFVLWFIVGLLPHMQLIPLEMTVATRWFYFPMIGLLGIFGVVITVFLQSKKLRHFLFPLSVVLLLVYSGMTIHRLGQWKNAITLYRHDVTKTESYLLEHSFGYELLQQKQLDEAGVHLQKAVTLFPTAMNTNSLGVYYYQKNDIASAKKWFAISNSYGDSYLAYQNLSRILLQYDSPQKAKAYVEVAVKKFPQSSTLWYLLALASYKSGDTDRALRAALQSYEISPTQENGYVVNQLQRGEEVVIK